MAPEITPIALDIPKDGATCCLSAVDTTCALTVEASMLVQPAIPGHEMMNFPTLSFLIKHSPSGRQILFDLGCRKDFWKLPEPLADVIDKRVPGIRVDKNLVDVLIEGGVDVSKLEAAIVSHHHYDHIGDPATFPKSMDLVVGPGFSEHYLPGYPTAEESPAWEEAFEGRNVREVTFSDNFVVAGYQANDYFGDGSLYILNTPGHTIAHISALVRTTIDTFVFLGGDICHFGGNFRPSEYVHLPEWLSSDDIGQLEHRAAPYACSVFTEFHPEKNHATTSPYYEICNHADSWYHDPSEAQKSVNKLITLDASDRILVLIAHDPILMRSIPLFPHGVLDDWQAAGWKEKIRWGFLDELPLEGKKQVYLADGTFKDGKRIKTIDGTRVE